MAAGSTEVRQVHAFPDTFLGSVPEPSPDGSTIVIDRLLSNGSPGGDHAIYAVKRDGSGLTRLSEAPPAQDYSPTWSPDGTKILFTSRRDGNSELYMMNRGRFQPDPDHVYTLE